MAVDYRQLEELRDACARHGVAYLVIGKSGALLHGFPDTTQDVDLFIRKTLDNGRALVRALRELQFRLSDQEAKEIEQGKDFVQLKNGPFDIDLVYAPDGIERFEDAWTRGIDVDGIAVCSLDDIIASKQAANRVKDRETLPRLIAFRDYLRQHQGQRKRLGALPANRP